MATELDRARVEIAQLELRVMELEGQNHNIMACFHTILRELKNDGHVEMAQRLTAVLQMTQPVSVSPSHGSSRQ